MRISSFAILGLALLAATPSAAVIVDVNALTNSGLNDANAVSLVLGAGRYRVTPVVGTFTAFNRFGNVAQCNSEGAQCRTGFEHSYFVGIDGAAIGYGSNNGNGGIGPQSTGGYYATALQAFVADAAASSFTLTAPTTVRFYIFDDIVGDNIGGVSLNVAAVPEPASWAMLIAGFGLVGATLRRRATARA